VFRRVLIAMTTLLVTMVGVPSLASAEPATPRAASTEAGWIRIVNYNSNMCLAIGGGNAYAGATAIQWPCNGQAEQLWYVNGSAWSPIRYDSEFCLAIGGGSTVSGAKAILWPCNGGPEQLWYVGGASISPVLNYNSGKCLAIGGGSRTRGAAAIQWTCNGGPEQDWWFYN
jgi:alcohol dehydrogenase class IV